MTKSLSSASISLDDYPAIQNIEKTEITIGDLHANALKFIHLLVREGIFFITPDNYEKFKTLYVIPAELIEAHELKQLQNIIEGMEVRQTHIFVRLIGDERSDRGNNDWYIDLILKKMNSCNIQYEIILSNHGFNSLKRFEQFNQSHLFFNPATESALYPLEKECASLEEQITHVNQEIQSVIEAYADDHPIQEFHRLSCLRLEAYIDQF